MTPGTNAGTGYPITFKCAKCRKAPHHSHFNPPLLATGRTRPADRKGIRQTTRRIEYYCQDCGHFGWTQHIDAERFYAAWLALHPSAQRIESERK
jgi:hypothetical protein